MDRSQVGKNKKDREIKLEYSHDRLMNMKVIQVYQLLVPDKFWSKNSEKQTSNIKGETPKHASCRDIRKSLFGYSLRNINPGFNEIFMV
jgi:hypothetical protein